MSICTVYHSINDTILYINDLCTVLWHDNVMYFFQHDYQPTEDSKLETICRTVSLVLSELSQLVTGFTYCYENEMSHWCNKSPPNLTQLGPAFKRVHKLLQQFIQVVSWTNHLAGIYVEMLFPCLFIFFFIMKVM